MAKRKRHSATFKARVALEAVKGLKTIQELASDYGVHPNVISKWKKQLVSQSAEVFQRKNHKGSSDHEEVEARLYQEIGRLKVELDWLKKKAALFD